MDIKPLHHKLLTDEEFLKVFIDSFDVHYNELMVGLKDLNNNFLIVSKKYASHMGMHRAELTKVCQRVKSDNHLIGLDARDIALHEKYEEVIRTKKSLKYVDIHNKDGDTYAFVFLKAPVINPDTENVVGVIHKLEKFFVPYIQHLFVPSSDIGSVNLTKISDREQTVLFFMSLGIINYKQIADIMTKLRGGDEISHDNIKYSAKKLLKLTDTAFYSDMLNKLAANGYIFDIPKTFLKKGTFFIGQLDFY